MFAIPVDARLNILSPVLGAVVIGIVKVNAVHPMRVFCNSCNGNSMKSEQLSVDVGYENADGVRIDQLIVIIIVRVVSGIKEFQESVVVQDISCYRIKYGTESFLHPVAVKGRVYPAMAVLSAEGDTGHHLAVNLIQMRDEDE